jgi:peptidylprolyl isomerase
MKKYPIIAIGLLAASLLVYGGCGGSSPEETPAQVGDTVRVDYVGTLEDGTEFDSSFGGEPLQFTIGDGSMIVGFDRAIIGMRPGETKKVVIPADQAYPYREELVFVFDRDNLPEGEEPKVGEQVPLQGPDGQVFPATVIEVTESTVTVDANSPLVGKDLTFDLLLVEIL